MPEALAKANQGLARIHAYGLSPMQSGMLFQALLDAPNHSHGYDVEQLHIALQEDLNPELLGRAFTIVARRHPVLSTCFRWEDVESPLQLVERAAVVPVETDNWSGLCAGERERRREAFLISDRGRGFDLRVAPLMRLTVFALGQGQSELVWTFHHILLDGRSFATILQEAFSQYDALLRAEPIVLPLPPPPYEQFISWLSRRNSAGSRRFFRELLRGKTVPTPLPGAEPASHPLPATGYGEVARIVDEPTAARARESARHTETTLGTILQAAWGLVLSRFTGDDDIVFGSTRACRRTALEGRAESMVGLFINTLPVRARMNDDRTVRDLLADLRAQSVAMREHEHTPLVEIQAESEQPAGTPLFESLMMFETKPLIDRLRASGCRRWQTASSTLHEQPAPPLTVTVFDSDKLELRILYDKRRFRPAVVERLAEAMEEALRALSHDDHRRLSELDVVPAADRKRILVEWNDTTRPFPDHFCIHEPFEARALSQPDAVAVEMNGTQLTYAELERRSNRLAHALRMRGARPGVYVGICLSRGLDLVVALLGVAKSGAAYVPLDPQYPRERLSFMVADANALLVITEERHRELCEVPLLVMDAEGDAELAAMSVERPSRLGSPADVCYAIFTSGSTGTPKGVVLTHRAVINTFDWVTRTFDVTIGDRLLFVTSPCFDLSVYDTFGVLGAGATVVVASDECLRDPARLASLIVDQGITIWDSAPAALQRLEPFFSDPPFATSPVLDGSRLRSRVASLRLVMLSGDYIPLKLPDAVRKAAPKAEVVSLGGATEAAIWSNWFPIGAIDSRWTTIPYGRPIQNARYHVLDRRMIPTPIGVSGDLYIGGACLADGYLNRPELTNERFVEDPFRPGERLYKTGDLARYFDDGNLEFLGRADFQVKIRGFRVEIGEIEAVLTAVPGVREGVCSAYVDASGAKSLIAHVVLRPGANLDEHDLRRKVADKVPEFMVPSQVMVLDALPMSSNGKVDRKALPHPTTRTAASLFVAPRTPIEREIAAIWEDVLQRRPIGISDDFFKLGGHSLLAVMLISRLKKQLGIDLPLSRMMERPTIETLVASLNEKAKEASRSRHLVTLSAKGSRPPLVLLPGAGGYSFIYKDLPALLGADQPVYALQAIGAEGDGPVADLSIEEMAEIYEQEVVETRPDGPIVLAGYSFGVLVAFELARRLRRLGRQVPLLVSLDGFAPGFPRILPIPQRFLSHISVFWQADSNRRRDYLRTRLLNVRRRVLEMFGRSQEPVVAIPFADADMNRRLGELWASLWRARNRYCPQGQEPCGLLLIKAESPERWIGSKMDDPLYGWGSFITGPISAMVIPGEHLRLFETGKQRLMADAISRRIASFCGNKA